MTTKIDPFATDNVSEVGDTHGDLRTVGVWNDIVGRRGLSRQRVRSNGRLFLWQLAAGVYKNQACRELDIRSSR